MNPNFIKIRGGKMFINLLEKLIKRNEENIKEMYNKWEICKKGGV